MSEIGEFAQKAQQALFREADEYRSEGRDPVLHSLFRLHDLLFQRVTAQEAGVAEPDRFVIDLLEVIGDELRRHHVSVVQPQPGDPVDLTYMETNQEVAARFWRKPDTVARILRCGFVEDKDDVRRLLQLAVVDVYRKSK